MLHVTKKIVIILIVISGLFGCYYKGDGKYYAEGMPLLFKFHKVTLPEFYLDESGKFQFILGGIPTFGRGFNIKLHVESAEKIPYWLLDTLLILNIREKDTGKTIVHKKARLNEHDKRIIRFYTQSLVHIEDSYILPKQYEWSSMYYFPDSDSPSNRNKRNINISPKLTLKNIYLGGIYDGFVWYKDYIVTINIVSPDVRYKNLKAYLTISSTWK